MKILIVPDVKGWAIDHLAQSKIKYNPHHEFRCHYVHPRDAGQKETQDEFMRIVEEFKPDVIHFEYYRSCSQLLEACPDLKCKKIILTHHNQRTKALREADWFMIGVDKIVTHTNKCKQYLIEECGQPEKIISVINHGIDMNEFWYSDEEPEEPKVGYVGRIVPWKGLKDIARACKELGYTLQVMGRQDKASYWQEILQEGLDKVMDFTFFECEDEDRRNAYKNMTIYVGNSIDGYEEGTMPYLEAMACGTPVVTTLNGVANDIAQDQENCLVVDFSDYDGLKLQIKKLMEDKDLREKLRKNAWDTVRNMTQEKMANEYSELYHKTKYPEDNLISVIIPTTLSRLDLLPKQLDALKNQTYKNIEIVIIFDEVASKLVNVIEAEKQLRSDFPSLTMKFDTTGNESYGLAQARNMGAIMADGKNLVFLDSRLLPDKESIEIFNECLEQISDKIWYFGDKGSQKKNFVENFSAINREQFMIFGMFCERINAYGGMSQEVRTRWTKQGGRFEYLNDARAIQLKKASKNKKRRQDIINMKDLLRHMYKGNNH